MGRASKAVRAAARHTARTGKTTAKMHVETRKRSFVGQVKGTAAAPRTTVFSKMVRVRHAQSPAIVFRAVTVGNAAIASKAAEAVTEAAKVVDPARSSAQWTTVIAKQMAISLMCQRQPSRSLSATAMGGTATLTKIACHRN